MVSIACACWGGSSRADTCVVLVAASRERGGQDHTWCMDVEPTTTVLISLYSSETPRSFFTWIWEGLCTLLKLAAMHWWLAPAACRRPLDVGSEVHAAYAWGHMGGLHHQAHRGRQCVRTLRHLIFLNCCMQCTYEGWGPWLMHLLFAASTRTACEGFAVCNYIEPVDSNIHPPPSSASMSGALHRALQCQRRLAALLPGSALVLHSPVPDALSVAACARPTAACGSSTPVASVRSYSEDLRIMWVPVARRDEACSKI